MQAPFVKLVFSHGFRAILAVWGNGPGGSCGLSCSVKVSSVHAMLLSHRPYE